MIGHRFTPADVARALRRHPQLSVHGIEVYGDEGGERDHFPRRRGELLDAVRLLQINAAAAVLQTAPRAPAGRGIGSYDLKHRIERYLETTGEPCNVCNGAGILAIILLGIPILRWGLNPRIGIRRTWLTRSRGRLPTGA